MSKPVFYDRFTSNNAARIRLWLYLKGKEDDFEVQLTKHAQQLDPKYQALNPLGKLPLLVLPSGQSIAESSVILSYLEDKYKGLSPSLRPDSPEDRAHMEMVIRVHDVYIASPNCTQPGFTHTQGCMYLGPTESHFTPKERTIPRPARAAKLAELWKQLDILEGLMWGPYFVGSAMTLADLTLYPTFVFFVMMLPLAFRWPDVFHGRPKLCAWMGEMEKNAHVQMVKRQILDAWEPKLRGEGDFDAIIEETKDSSFKW
eukprot:CAMPEP_0174297490 /NCGR_PEP_ID=MMETSP0809-20121228/51179_1 /TAXON_ID=73025 ORGANISM="Eutreptiella gymnastica-like, Strain CCMP1594" /NCGR_SAMPLE_ID=MMETSP0809 /ASSEMBLY_ACC=CAM_ASM_000658 /LENGTH=257 /DNA_ID=CAMNT_0015401309 /DNA_START=42 /DNA_END=812 /DNA_ORIENTATION=-